MAIGKGTKEGDDLKARAERITGLEDQVKDLARQAKEIKAQVAEEFDDAESAGFNKRVMRQVIKELALDAADRQAVFDFESEVDVYRHALGIEPDGSTSAPAAQNERSAIEALTDGVVGIVSAMVDESIAEPKPVKPKAKKPAPLSPKEQKIADAERTSAERAARAKRESQKPLEVVR